MVNLEEYNIGENISFTDMQAISQENVSCRINWSVQDDIIIHSVNGIEEISSLFTFYVNIFSSNDSINGADLLGSNATIEIGDQPRYINGIITKFSHGITNVQKHYTHYTIEIKPKVWLLTLNKTCKIFQEKTAVEIITSILNDNKIEFVDNVSSCGKRVRNYCVQYNESDFDFISRLMEEEGIFYFFQHNSDNHQIILCDSCEGYADIAESTEVPVSQFNDQNAPFDTINDVKLTNSYSAGSFATTDYNYTISSTDLSVQLQGKNPEHEIFEYPGDYENINDGNKISELRLQYIEKNMEMLIGTSKVARFTPGHKFDMTHHISAALNKSYVIFHVDHKLNLQDHGIYKNTFFALDSSVVFRPQRKTPRPFITGTQTAVVTGPDGEEIYTDNFRRIKVHFHWDREGQCDENSSCWIRVAQIWAGNNWGGLYTPRIGQEVVVSFENGNPDKPIVVGCVYNDKYMPPYSDTDATKSTIKTATSKGEEGFNELRFEDMKDSEEIYIHAQKDMNIDIINERTTLIEESNDTLTISKGSRTELLNAEGDDPGNYSTTLTKGDKSLTIKEGNWDVLLEKGNNTVTLSKGDMSVTLSDGNMDVSIKGNYSISVDGDLSISTTGNISIESQKNISMSSKANTTIESSQNIKTSSTMKTQMEAKQDFSISSMMNVMADGKMNVKLQAGIAMDIMAANITINGSAAVNATGGASFNISSPSVAIGGGVIALG